MTPVNPAISRLWAAHGRTRHEAVSGSDVRFRDQADQMVGKFHEIRHPLVQHKLSYLRQRSAIVNFRDYESLIYELGLLLGYEASSQLELTDIDLSRSIIRDGEIAEWRAGKRIKTKPVIVPIVRSGLIMADAMRRIIPTPYMGHIGVYDARTASGEVEPQEFMVTMPDDFEGRQFILADLFIDRGKTASRAINILLEYGIVPADIIFVALIISPEGRSEVLRTNEAKDINFYCARLDIEEDRWLPDYKQTNFRLFRTENRPDLLQQISNQAGQ